MKLNREWTLLMYKKMLQMRRFEERIAELYHRGLVPSSAHLYIGQEAVATGVCAALNRDDFVLTTHRGHAHNIAKDVPLDRLAAEILGKATGLCKGKGGSMRVTWVESGVLYSCPIVGANIPIAVGVGLSIKMRRTGQVVACFFGDGASNIGDFHEGLNLASLWNLPVLFVCENNLYGLSVSAKRSITIEDVAERASSYGMPGMVVDGNNVVAVYEAAKEAAARARSEGGPILIECKTYRWLGHHAGDPGTDYRSSDEVEAWKERCPIEKVKEQLIEMDVSKDELERIEGEIKKEVEEAIEFAVKSPYPEAEALLEDVF